MHGGQNYSLEQSQVASSSKPRYHTLTSIAYYDLLLHMIMKMADDITAEFSLAYPDPTQVEGEERNDPFSTSS